MRSFALISALLAATALAVPTANGVTLTPRAPTIDDISASAKSLMDEKTAAGCSVLKCLAALAPNAISCASALAEDGINVLADAACFASALNNIENPPAACANCG